MKTRQASGHLPLSLQPAAYYLRGYPLLIQIYF